jgi:arylsulfatase A-like enzyme
VGPELDPELVARLRILDSRPGSAEMMARELGLYYDAEVAGVDRAVGLALDWLQAAGLAADTMVVVVGSEGVEFFERGGRLTGQTLFDEVVTVPLIVAGPQVRGPFVVEQAIDLVDVSRLLAAFTGSVNEEKGVGPEVGSLQGRLPPPFGPSVAEALPAASLLKPYEPLTRHDLEAVRLGPWLLIKDRGADITALFDLSADPLATDNLLRRDDSAHWARQAATLERAYERWYRTGIMGSAARPWRGD